MLICYDGLVDVDVDRYYIYVQISIYVHKTYKQIICPNANGIISGGECMVLSKLKTYCIKLFLHTISYIICN